MRDESPLAIVGQRYGDYLKKERGLSPVTIGHHLQFARRLLGERFGDGPIRVRDLAPATFAFPLATRSLGQSRSGQADGDGPASFFRFLFLTGRRKVTSHGAVPTVPQWRLAEGAEVPHAG